MLTSKKINNRNKFDCSAKDKTRFHIWLLRKEEDKIGICGYFFTKHLIIGLKSNFPIDVYVPQKSVFYLLNEIDPHHNDIAEVSMIIDL